MSDLTRAYQTAQNGKWHPPESPKLEERISSLEELVETLDFKIAQVRRGLLCIQPPPMEDMPLIEFIIELCCRSYNVSRNELRSNQRVDRIMWPRHIAMYLAAAFTGFSLPTISRHFNRDHTTIINGRNRIASLRKTEAAVDCKLKLMEAAIMERYPECREPSRNGSARPPMVTFPPEFDSEPLKKILADASSASDQSTPETNGSATTS